MTEPTSFLSSEIDQSTTNQADRLAAIRAKRAATAVVAIAVQPGAQGPNGPKRSARRHVAAGSRIVATGIGASTMFAITAAIGSANQHAASVAPPVAAPIAAQGVGLVAPPASVVVPLPQTIHIYVPPPDSTPIAAVAPVAGKPVAKAAASSATPAPVQAAPQAVVPAAAPVAPPAPVATAAPAAPAPAPAATTAPSKP